MKVASFGISRTSTLCPRRTFACKNINSSTKRVKSSFICKVAAQPSWTGDTVASHLINWAISVRPIFAILKLFARITMKLYMSNKNFDWDAHVQTLAEEKELEKIKMEIEDTSVVYPSYYFVPFHSYENGNLDWMAAYEALPATYGMSVNIFKSEPTAEGASAKLRGRVSEVIEGYRQQHSLAAPRDILDVGCSIGMSTRPLAELYPQARVTGLDLSPYFLAVAEWEERKKPTGGKRITYKHGSYEESGFPDASFDMISMQFVAHELPQTNLTHFLQISKRLLKPNGVLVFVDTNSKSATVQNLPPAISTLMKATEPWSDEFHSYDLEGAMVKAGYKQVTRIETNTRHCAFFGIL